MSSKNFLKIWEFFEKFLLKFLIFFIKIYKILLSPLLPYACRFNPSCSSYAMESFQKYGLFKALFLSLRRILRCHPFGGYGEDPVP